MRRAAVVLGASSLAARRRLRRRRRGMALRAAGRRRDRRAGSARRSRRHRVLGAEPRHADHRRQRRRRRRASTPTTAPAGTATRPSAAATTGGSPGPGPTSSGRSPTSRPARKPAQPPAQHISLCHFKDGQVVASYAEPIGVAELLPADGRRRLRGPRRLLVRRRTPARQTSTIGAFHLHWDGTLAAPAAVARPNRRPNCRPGPRGDRASPSTRVGFYESVAGARRRLAPGEPKPPSPSSCTRSSPAPRRRSSRCPRTAPIDYGAGAEAERTAKASTSAATDDGLWAISGAPSAPATVTVLRLGEDGLRPSCRSIDPDGVLGAGRRRSTASPPSPAGDTPGSASHSPANRIGAASAPALRPTSTPTAPSARRSSCRAEGEGIGARARPGRSPAPAAGQCWMATAARLALPPRSRPRPRTPTRRCTRRRSPSGLATTACRSCRRTRLPEDDSGAKPKRRRTEEPLPEVEPNRCRSGVPPCCPSSTSGCIGSDRSS